MVMPRLRSTGRPLRAEVGAGEVGVDHLLEGLLAHAQQQGVIGQPGVGHEHLDRAVLGLDRGEGSVHVVAGGDIALHGEQAVGRTRAPMRHGHVVTLRREGLGDGPADPPVAAGDQHGPRRAVAGFAHDD